MNVSGFVVVSRVMPTPSAAYVVSPEFNADWVTALIIGPGDPAGPTTATLDSVVPVARLVRFSPTVVVSSPNSALDPEVITFFHVLAI